MNTLHEQQRSFARFIINNDDEQSGAGVLSLKQSSTGQFKDSQRLQVYQNNFLISLREALAGVYPVIAMLVGEEFFQHVSREYVRRCPSCTGNLHDFGDEFANFLKRFPGLESLPYLPDVARLEWARHHVFHAAEDKVLNLTAIATLNEKQMAEITFQLSGSCVYLSSDYPILQIWQANQDDQDTQTVLLEEGGVQCVVLRHGQHIEFHQLSAGVFAMVCSLAEHNTFAQACEDALEAEIDCDISASLKFLVDQRIVSGFSSLSATLLE